MAASCLYASDVQSVPAVPSMWKVILSLVFVVAFIPLCLWVMKRLQFTQMKLSKSDIKIMNVQSLGAKEKLMVIEVDQERMLIGVTAHSITHLRNLASKSDNFSKVLNDIETEQSNATKSSGVGE